jgi:hypothetical protein
LNKNELIAVLKAYHEAIEVACPGLHPEMQERSKHWASADADLARELERYLDEASRPTCPVRVFFKLGRELKYGGCNAQFAADAGLPSRGDLVGLDDFDERISWVAQAAKYRKDDREVMERAQAKLGIVERQSSASGVIWLETSKVPVKDSAIAIGVFGTYEIIDAKTAARRSAARQR